MWQHTTKRNSRADQSVQLLVTANGELQVTGRDALDLEVLGGVAGQLEHLGSEVFEDGGDVDGGLGADAHFLLGVVFEEALYAAAGELGEEGISAGSVMRAGGDDEGVHDRRGCLVL